ncbi:hypothetical protein MJ561_10050 [Klebsiella pneumoniae]|nr:hypothetical protein MJ561_10050 [Klebsiella pneumoniae]
MKTLKHWSLHQQLEHHVELTVDGQHTCACTYWKNLFRVLLKRRGQLALDRLEHRSAAGCAVGRPRPG